MRGLPGNTLFYPQMHLGSSKGLLLAQSRAVWQIRLYRKRGGGNWWKNVPSSPVVELNHMYIFKIQRKGTTLQHMFKSRVLFQRFQKISG